MSWLQKLLPPKIQRTGGAKKTVPEGLWTKCASCDAVLYSTDLEKNLSVCPKCGHHERLGARFNERPPGVDIATCIVEAPVVVAQVIADRATTTGA